MQKIKHTPPSSKSKKILKDLRQYKKQRNFIRAQFAVTDKNLADHLQAAELSNAAFDGWLFEQYQEANRLLEETDLGACHE
jgi:hypothetical protein